MTFAIIPCSSNIRTLVFLQMYNKFNDRSFWAQSQTVDWFSTQTTAAIFVLCIVQTALEDVLFDCLTVWLQWLLTTAVSVLTCCVNVCMCMFIWIYSCIKCLYTCPCVDAAQSDRGDCSVEAGTDQWWVWVGRLQCRDWHTDSLQTSECYRTLWGVLLQQETYGL